MMRSYTKSIGLNQSKLHIGLSSSINQSVTFGSLDLKQADKRLSSLACHTLQEFDVIVIARGSLAYDYRPTYI